MPRKILITLMLSACGPGLNMPPQEDAELSDKLCTTECPDITGFSPVGSEENSQVTMRGKNFYAGMNIQVGGVEITPEVMSESVAVFTMPCETLPSLATMLLYPCCDCARRLHGTS